MHKLRSISFLALASVGLLMVTFAAGAPYIIP
jgi:hypothetical protein